MVHIQSLSFILYPSLPSQTGSDASTEDGVCKSGVPLRLVTRLIYRRVRALSRLADGSQWKHGSASLPPALLNADSNPQLPCLTKPELPGRRGVVGIRVAEVRRLELAAKANLFLPVFIVVSANLRRLTGGFTCFPFTHL